MYANTHTINNDAVSTLTGYIHALDTVLPYWLILCVGRAAEAAVRGFVPELSLAVPLVIPSLLASSSAFWSSAVDLG